MSTTAPSTAQPAVAVPLVVGPPRPPLVRPREDRMLGGVAHGLADHLGLTVPAARLLLLASILAGGFGGFLYLWLWALVPAGPEPAPDAPARTFKQQLAAIKATLVAGRHGRWQDALLARRAVPPVAAPAPLPPPMPPAPVTAPAPPVAHTVPPEAPEVPAAAAADDADTTAVVATRRPPRIRRSGDLLAGVLLVLAGGVLLLSRQGWVTNPGLVLPLLVLGAGAIIAYAQLDEVERNRWASRSGVGTRGAVLRIIGGLVLAVVGILLFFVQGADVGQLGRTLLAAVAVLAGTVLVLAPWGLRLWRDLDEERAARIRESERADIAAHLHDSVLQTLALIQRRSTDPAEVVRLARAQERDLRGWLYGASAVNPSTLAARVAAITAEAEDVHGAVIEVVTVGDRPVDDRTRAMLAALREAVFNAARHAGAPVQVYVESGPTGVEAFVRDRGVGFELAAVPEDRLGVRESVIGRMERHGGSARVRSAPGDGTEVRLLMPDEEEVST